MNGSQITSWSWILVQCHQTDGQTDRQTESNAYEPTMHKHRCAQKWVCGGSVEKICPELGGGSAKCSIRGPQDLKSKGQVQFLLEKRVVVLYNTSLLRGKYCLKWKYFKECNVSHLHYHYKISGAWQTACQTCIRSAFTGRVMADVSSDISPIFRTFA